MNNGFLRVSNKITVIASIILPIVFICGTFMTGYFVYGENIGGILFFLVYFLVTTIGFWGAMIQGLRSISNGMAKTIRSAAVFQTIMYIAHILDAVILFYSQRNSAYSGMRTFLGIFIFIFMIMIVLAAARIKIAKKCADKGAAVEGSSGFAFFIFLFCIIIPVASIVLVILGSKFVDAHPGVVKVAGITGAIIWMLICSAAFLGVFSFLDKLGFGGGGFETDAPKIVFSGELPVVGEPSIVKVDMSEQSVMGFDEWYGECETDEYGFSCWTFYNSDEEVIGEQFGWDCADYPRVYIRDFDGDGVNDLLCADTFNADGADRLYIYRMNNGVIEEGFVDYMSLETKYGLEGELCVMAYNEYYDESSDRMFFEYYYAQSGDGIYDITLDDFTFYEYEYIAY